jgi:hypothetical protein
VLYGSGNGLTNTGRQLWYEGAARFAKYSRRAAGHLFSIPFAFPGGSGKWVHGSSRFFIAFTFGIARSRGRLLNQGQDDNTQECG